MVDNNRFKNESQDARRHDEQHAVHPYEKHNKKRTGSAVPGSKMKKAK